MPIPSTLLHGTAILGIVCVFGQPATSSGADSITVTMKPCKVARPAKFDITIKDGKPVIAQKDSSLVRQGEVNVNGEKFGVFLPAAKTYSVKNTGKGDGQFENTSTLISIDSNHDGTLTGDEEWFASLPIRIGDRMFDVVSIAADGSVITLKPSASPLAGVIVGRKMPAFAYKNVDGKTITQDSFRGRTVLLDVWSHT